MTKARPVGNEPDDVPPPGHRVPPHDTSTEAALIGAALIDEQAAAVAAALPPGAWYNTAHAAIAATIRRLSDEGSPIDPHLVTGRLASAGLLDEIGGHQTLVDAMASCAVPSSAPFYAATLRGLARNRDVIAAAQAALDAAYQGDIDAAVGSLEAGLDGQDNALAAPVLGDLLADHLDLLELRQSGGIVTVPTGISDLDDVFGGGLKKGELYVIGARPGMGKTVVGGTVAMNAAQAGQRVLFASLEMSTSELLDRWLGGHARIDTVNLQQGHLHESEWLRISSSMKDLTPLDLRVFDRPEATVAEIRSAALSYRADLVVVDYLGLIRPAERRQNRQEEVAQIARSLKAMSRRLDCPVVTLAQLNRGVESRIDKRPGLADLRESGEVEQSAGAVVMLYRPHYYDSSADPGLIELIVCKNRHGRMKTIEAAWLDKLQRVADLTHRTPEWRSAS